VNLYDVTMQSICDHKLLVDIPLQSGMALNMSQHSLEVALCMLGANCTLGTRIVDDRN